MLAIPGTGILAVKQWSSRLAFGLSDFYLTSISSTMTRIPALYGVTGDACPLSSCYYPTSMI
jgi:hypothetical protein